MFTAESTAELVTEGLDLGGKTFLITGCNSGLGLESARVLANRGAHIIGLARSKAKATEALNTLPATTAVACDLSDLDSVRTAVAAVAATGCKLDAIIANAGIMALPTLQQKNGIELQFYTNHVGHFALITGLVAADALTEDGRIVVVSSAAHFMAGERGLELDNLSGEVDYHAWRMYGRSKLANVLFARSLAKRFAGTRRTANALHPGVIQTNLARHVDNPEQMFERLKPQLKTVGQGAATQVYLATHPALATVSGAYYSDCQATEPLPLALDEALAEALWERTQALVQG